MYFVLIKAKKKLVPKLKCQNSKMEDFWVKNPKTRPYENEPNLMIWTQVLENSYLSIKNAL